METTTVVPTSTTKHTIPQLTPDQKDRWLGRTQSGAATHIEIPQYTPRDNRRWQANQYGCHSDGRCLDDYGTWCDEDEWVELEGASGGEVCHETFEWLADELAAEYEDE